MFGMIDNEHPREQLQFMSEDLHGERSWEKCGVHEDAFAEGQVIGNWRWLAKGQFDRRIGPRWLAAEDDLDIRQAERRLVDDEHGRIRGRRGEGGGI